jgi:energy-coupling factor transport system ATP-binding protein
MTAPIRLTDVRFHYRQAIQPALRGVNLELAAGQTVALTGKTGAGKTTLARACTGLVPFLLKGELSGRVDLFGVPLTRAARYEAARRTGLVFQDFEAQLFSTTLRSEVAFALECRGVPRHEMQRRVDENLARVGLAEFADREPAALSGGQKQRLAIAGLLAVAPELLILDEPTTDLDPVGKQEVMALLAELAAEGRSILLIEHETDLLRQADRLVFFADGAVAVDAPRRQFDAHAGDLPRFGVRPPDLYRLWSLLGLPAPPRAVGEALRALRESGFTPDPSRLPPRPAASPVLFALDNVTFAYPHSPPVFTDLNLTLGRGEAVAILGANGAGKTTLVGLLNGLRRPARGRVVFDSEDIAARRVSELGRRIGYVFQNPDHQLFAPTVREEAAFSLKVRGVPESEWPARITRALARVGLTGVDEQDPFVMTKGERQKLALASVLVHEPEVVILDEPTTGLDGEEQEAMIALLHELKQQGHTLILITHSMDTALAVADRTIVMADGRILADGPTPQVFAQDSTLAQAHLRAPVAAQLSAALGLGGLNVAMLARCLARRPA